MVSGKKHRRCEGSILREGIVALRGPPSVHPKSVMLMGVLDERHALMHVGGNIRWSWGYEWCLRFGGSRLVANGCASRRRRG